jgi:drug/metabolite transporter (DMT)-like permease
MGGLYALISLACHFDRESYKAVRSKFGSLFVLSIAGFLAVSIFTFGLNYTTTVNSALIMTTTIVATALFSYLLLGEHFEKRQLPWILVLFIGLYIGIVGFKAVQLQKGDLIVFGSVLFFGFGNAFSRVVMRDMKRPGIVPDMRLFMGAMMALVFIFLTARNYAIFMKILPLALLAGLFYWLCMKSFAKSVHLLNAHETIVLNNSQIFSTSVASVLILSEKYSLEKFFGSVVVIISIYFISARTNKALVDRV